MTNPLEKEFLYYVAHQKEFVTKYAGKILVIKGEQIIGVYEDQVSAIKETAKKHAMGSFLVQECEPGDDNYTQTYHSRVMFN